MVGGYRRVGVNTEKWWVSKGLNKSLRRSQYVKFGGNKGILKTPVSLFKWLELKIITLKLAEISKEHRVSVKIAKGLQGTPKRIFSQSHGEVDQKSLNG